MERVTKSLGPYREITLSYGTNVHQSTTYTILYHIDRGSCNIAAEFIPTSSPTPHLNNNQPLRAMTMWLCLIWFCKIASTSEHLHLETNVKLPQEDRWTGSQVRDNSYHGNIELFHVQTCCYMDECFCWLQQSILLVWNIILKHGISVTLDHCLCFPCHCIYVTLLAASCHCAPHILPPRQIFAKRGYFFMWTTPNFHLSY